MLLNYNLSLYPTVFSTHPVYSYLISQVGLIQLTRTLKPGHKA